MTGEIIMSWIGTIFLPAFIVLATFHWFTRMELEEVRNDKNAYKESYCKQLRHHMEWEHKYNQLLKNFQRYIDEHGDNQHHCNCYKKEVVTDDNTNDR